MLRCLVLHLWPLIGHGGGVPGGYRRRRSSSTLELKPAQTFFKLPPQWGAKKASSMHMPADILGVANKSTWQQKGVAHMGHTLHQGFKIYVCYFWASDHLQHTFKEVRVPPLTTSNDARGGSRASSHKASSYCNRARFQEWVSLVKGKPVRDLNGPLRPFEQLLCPGWPLAPAWTNRLGGRWTSRPMTAQA